MQLYQPTITGSLSVSGSINLSGSITLADGGTISGTASIATNAITASSADNFLVRNTLTAQTLVVQTITSSVDFVTGSTRFGSIAANTHTFTGSVLVSGSIGIGTLPSTDFSLHLYTPSSTRLKIEYGTSTAGALDFYSGSTAQWSVVVDNNQTYGKIENRILSSDAIRFYNSNNTVVLSPTTGSVGIGITNPTYKLDINGSGSMINIIGASSGDIATGFRIGRGSSLGAEIYDNPADNITTFNTTGGLNFRVGGSNRLTIASSGAATFSNFVKVSGNNALGTSSTGGMEMAYFGAEAKSRIIIGDGSGYSFSLSKRTSSTNTDLFTITDSGAATFSSSVTAGSDFATILASDSSTNLFRGTFVTGNGSSAAGKVRFGGGESGQLRAYMEAIQSWNGSYTDSILNFFTTKGGVGGDIRMTINGSGNVGIGTSSPNTSSKLHVQGNSTPDDNIGYLLVENTTSGTGGQTNSAVNIKNYNGTSQFMQWQSNGIRLGSRVLTNSGTGAIYFTYGSDTVGMILKSDGTFAKTGDSSTMRILPATDNTGYIGESVGRWAAIYAANGTIQTSDGREKKDITNSDLGLDFINSLRPVSYKWIVGKNVVTYENIINEEGNEEQKEIVTPMPGVRTHYGLIAQEVKEVLGEKDFGGYVYDTDSDKMSLRYDQFIAPLIKSIQELKAEFDAYKATHP